MAGRRRARPDSPRAVVAAATRIPLKEPKAAARMVSKLQAWQDEAWQFFDEIGEVKFTTWWLANLVAKVQLYAAAVPTDSTDSQPIPASDPSAGVSPALAAAAEAEIARLQTQLGGQAEIQREFVMNIEVAGECYLVGWGARVDALGVEVSPEEWEIRSKSEVRVEGDGKFVVLAGPEDREGRKLDPELDTIIRLWQRHPRWSAQADSNLRALRTDCKVLQTLTEQLLAESNSRRSAGILLMPNEITWGRANDTTTGGGGDDEQDEDPFMADLAEALTTPISDPDSAASVVPLLARGPAEHLDKARLLSLGRTTDPAVDERIEKRVQRIARGLNAPVEVVMGHQQTTYANAEQVDEDKFTDHVEPRCLLLVDSLTYAFLRPNLIDAGFDAAEVERVFVWFDASDVIGDPDLRPWVELAWRMGLISDEAARRILGFSEDDAPTEEEKMGRIGATRGILTAELTTVLLQAGGYSFDVPTKLDPDAPVPAPAAPAPAPAPEEQAARIVAALRELWPEGPPPMARTGPYHPRMPQRS